MCGAAQSPLKSAPNSMSFSGLSFAVKCSCGSGYLYWRVRVALLTEFFLFSAGARASAGSPDDWNPSRQELLVQQDAGVSEEFSLLFLQLLVPSAALSKGRACLAEPPPPLTPAGYALVQYSFSRRWENDTWYWSSHRTISDWNVPVDWSASQVSRHSAQV